ncbi:hypothetical protein TSOC_012576, partial [Tetrabaena socialis]
GTTLTGVIEGVATGGESCLYAQHQSACALDSSPPPPPQPRASAFRPPPPPPVATYRPPPPPPPPKLVQTHTCAQATSNVPYTLTDVSVSNGVDQYGNLAIAMCTTVKAQAVASTCRANSTSCCAMDFAKLEVVINPDCKSDARRITINGEQVPYSWGFYEDLTAIKFVNLATTISKPAGAKLCWFVRPGKCATPETFCYNGQCQANVFSANNKCCPAYLI